MGMAKVVATMSTKTQPWQKTATATAPDLSQVISIDDDEPTLTLNVTVTITSILDTAMIEEDESLRSKQIHIMQESVDKLLQGCRSEQDLQGKIAMLTLEWNVAINNAVVNLHQYKNLQKDNIKLAEELNKLKKFQGSWETAPIIQKLKQQIKEKDDMITMQKQEISDTCAAWDKADAELTTL